MKEAVCVLLLKDGKVLAVSRRGEPDNMNLPGGKVDFDESPRDACVRETLEETGLKISNLRLVFRATCEGGSDGQAYDTHCFTADFEGTPEAKEPGFTVSWIQWDELLKSSNSFSLYNRQLYASLS